MMILKLIKLQIDNKLDFFKKDFRKALSSIGKYLLLLLLITTIGYYFSLRIFFLGFKSNMELISLVILITQIISFVFALGYIISDMFMSQENIMLMVLPATPNEIFISKIVVLYIKELFVNTIYTLPLLIIVGFSSTTLSPSFYYLLPLLMIVLPVFPLALASLLSVPLLQVINFLRKKLLIWIVVILGVVTFAFTAYMRVIKVVTLIFNTEQRQIDTIMDINKKVIDLGSKNFLYLNLTKGLISLNQLYWLFIFLLFAISIFFLGMWIIKPLYFKTAISSLDEGANKIYTKKNYKEYSPFTSLFLKEVRTVFRSPNYIFQYFLFTLLMPVIVIAYNQLLIPFTQNTIGESMIIGAYVLVISIMAFLSNVASANAISREGATFYLVKALPVDYYLQTKVKIAFNAILSVIMILITIIASSWFIEIKYLLVITPTIIFTTLGHMFLSYEFDLKEPTLDWYENGEMSKTGGATFKSIIGGLILAIFLGAMTFTDSGIMSRLWITLLFSIGFCLIRAHFLSLRIAYCYDRIEV